MPKLSVVIVSWNTRELLRECLESVLPTLSGIDHEVFVVDNASADGSARMVAERFPSVELMVNESNVGFARANNQAFARCSGEYVLIS